VTRISAASVEMAREILGMEDVGRKELTREVRTT
jgi:hypothetical protein